MARGSLFGRRNRAPRRAVPPLEGWERAWFLDGRKPERSTPEWPGWARRYFIAPAEDAARWREFRDELLAEWVAASPGTRPFAWWIHEGALLDARIVKGADCGLVESDAAFLRRLRHLMPGEEARIPAEDFEMVDHDEEPEAAA